MKTQLSFLLSIATVGFTVGCETSSTVTPASPATKGEPVEGTSEPPIVQTENWFAAGRNGAVSTAQPAATEAAMSILRAGGSAADAAAAGLLALSVSDHAKFHFGGEVTILVYSAAEKSVEVISGQGPAPEMATREKFSRNGIPSAGLLAAAVPGAPDAIVTLIERHGRKTFKEVVKPMQDLLKNGKESWHWKLAKTMRTLIKAEEEAKTGRRQGLVRVADAFYRGEIAHQIADWSKKEGGLLRYSDMARHTTRIESPSMVRYHGWKVFKAGSWTQGPALLQSLAMLDYFKFATTEQQTERSVHLAIEALKLAFADRDAYFGDPLFVDSPVDAFIYPYYMSLRRKLIDVDRAALEVWPGDPWNKKEKLEKLPKWSSFLGKSNDTSTCVVVDRDGNMVAATPSGWSGVSAGETGVWLGSRLQSFNTWADHPNVIAPGKRPRNTLTPTIVLDEEDRPVLAISVAGGDHQEQTTLQVLMNILDFKMTADKAVTTPRFATEHFVGSFKQTVPRKGVVKLNPDLEQAIGDALRAKGHKIEIEPAPIAEPSVVTVDWRRGIFRAAGDPKTGRSASAF
jgi:gamma-glutamyltranspeptidase / glutathione hydrolase